MFLRQKKVLFWGGTLADMLAIERPAIFDNNLLISAIFVLRLTYFCLQHSEAHNWLKVQRQLHVKHISRLNKLKSDLPTLPTADGIAFKVSSSVSLQRGL